MLASYLEVLILILMEHAQRVLLSIIQRLRPRS